jgi:hypothetical protein
MAKGRGAVVYSESLWRKHLASFHSWEDAWKYFADSPLPGLKIVEFEGYLGELEYYVTQFLPDKYAVYHRP